MENCFFTVTFTVILLMFSIFVITNGTNGTAPLLEPEFDEPFRSSTGLELGTVSETIVDTGSVVGLDAVVLMQQYILKVVLL
jgi:hypothetical protein